VALVALSTTRAQEPAPAGPAAAITYRVEAIEAGALAKRFTPAQLAILEKLNRRDVAHLARLTEIIVPDMAAEQWPQDDLAYSPLPLEWPSTVAQPTALIVDQPAQVFGAYEYGKLVRWGPVSTGRKETPTPAGSYNLTWRAKSRRSTDNEAWLLNWYFNFINSRGISFHEFDLPGQAASHACVRLLTRDAIWLYNWGRQWVLSPDKKTVAEPGTPVIIQGVVDFTTPAPWTAPDYWRTLLTLPTL
jgi:lipoprotein-anchoring transpeptidase ErfK/SrfK